MMYPTRPVAVDGQRFLRARARRRHFLPPSTAATPAVQSPPRATPPSPSFSRPPGQHRSADGVAAKATAAPEAAAVDYRSSGLLVDDHCTDDPHRVSSVRREDRVSLRFSTALVRDRCVRLL